MKTSKALADAVVIRPNRRIAVLMLALELVTLGVAVRAVLNEAYGLLPVAAIVAGAVGGWLALLLRGRTELRPDGIYNRNIVGSELLPWADVTGVLSAERAPGIRVVLRDGRNVRLAGVLGKRPVQGPGLDEIVAAVQEGIDRHRIADAAPEGSAPPTIERRLTWGPVRVPIVLLTGAGLVAGSVAATGMWWMALVAVPLLAAGGFLIAISTLTRTVVGPDGIRNRPFRKETFIPWADVAELVVSSTPPRTVQIVRRSGGTKTLAGVRDGDLHPDQITFDRLVEVIRQRAGLDGVSDSAKKAEPVRAEVPAGPLSMRPSKRPLLWTVPLALAFVPAAYLTIDNIAFLFIAGYLLVVPLGLLSVSGKLARGRTEAGPDGIRNRLVLKTKEIEWTGFDSFVVQPTLFGRVVQVVRTKSQKRVVLAAPREGLLGRDPGFDAKVESLRALAVANGGPAALQRPSPKVTRTIYTIPLVFVVVMGLFLWRPWLSPWWPAQHQATSLPRACALADEVTPRMVPGGKRGREQHDSDRHSAVSVCWVRGGDTHTRLEIELNLERRTLDSSGTDEAEDTFASRRRTLTPRPMPVPGLGDEALQQVEHDGSLSSVHLLIRRANVIIELRYEAKRPADQHIADITALARTALSRISTN